MKSWIDISFGDNPSCLWQAQSSISDFIPWLGTVYRYIQNRCPSCKSLISDFMLFAMPRKHTQQDDKRRPAAKARPDNPTVFSKSKAKKLLSTSRSCWQPGSYSMSRHLWGEETEREDLSGDSWWHWNQQHREEMEETEEILEESYPWDSMWAADMVTLGHWQNDQSQTNLH